MVTVLYAAIVSWVRTILLLTETSMYSVKRFSSNPGGSSLPSFPIAPDGRLRQWMSPKYKYQLCTMDPLTSSASYGIQQTNERF